jgi:membrane protein YdbS with pleckstrin-like domain
VILVLNIIFIILTLWFTACSVPSKGWMIFLFFLATQALFILKLFMKAWRYASVCEKVAIPERDSNTK